MVRIVSSSQTEESTSLLSVFMKGANSVVGYIGYLTVAILLIGSITVQTTFYQSRANAQKPEALVEGQEAMLIDDMLSMMTTLTSILGPLVASVIGYYFREDRNESGGP